MTTAIDTNILARALLDDDAVRSPRAKTFLAETAQISISTIVFAELVWVLRGKKVPLPMIATMLEQLVATGKVHTDVVRFHAGLAFLKRGGDFADGLVLHDAVRSDSIPVITFDRDFVRLGAPNVVLVD